MTEWQPIETAPKDGGPFLLLYTKRTWTDIRGNPVSFGPVRDYAEKIEPAWLENGRLIQAGTAHDILIECETWAGDDMRPTHWMPLPEPPAQEPE
jgi:hypothetical protein